VQIAIGDNRGNRMFTSWKTWKTFIERRAEIKRLMQSTVSSSPIQDLNVELVKIYNTNNVKLKNSMFVHEIIVFFLFELEQCVKHVFMN